MRGVLLFAFNNEQVNYYKLAKMCAKRIKHFWDLPVCLVTDEPEPKRKPKEITFWRQVEQPTRVNSKSYYDYGTALSFWNTNRHDAYALSPFQETILIDSDFLPSGRSVLNAWDGAGVKLTRQAHSVEHTELGDDVRFLGKSRIPMYWATIVCFDRSPVAQEFFRQWQNAVEFYTTYSHIYGFPPTPMRNDFAVTVALEKLKGSTQSVFFDLPYSIPTLLPGSQLHGLDPLIALVPAIYPDEFDILSIVSDLHVMNKKSLLELG